MTTILDSATSAPYRDKSIVGGSVSQMDRATVSRRLCGVCHGDSVHAKGRCRTCYQFYRRNGHDRRMASLHDKRKPTIVPSRGADEEQDSMTYAEWCASRGYNPKTKRYRPS